MTGAIQFRVIDRIDPPDDLCRNACQDAIPIGAALGDHRPGSDHSVVSEPHPREDDRIRPQPAMLSDVYRPLTGVLAQIPHIVIGGDQLHPGTDEGVLIEADAIECLDVTPGHTSQGAGGPYPLDPGGMDDQT